MRPIGHGNRVPVLLVESAQASGQMRRDVRPDIAAAVIVGGLMEGVIADEIATLACAGVSARPETPRILKRTRA
jgi:hypothetical protein